MYVLYIILLLYTGIKYIYIMCTWTFSFSKKTHSYIICHLLYHYSTSNFSHV